MIFITYNVIVTNGELHFPQIIGSNGSDMRSMMPYKNSDQHKKSVIISVKHKMTMI